MQSFYKNRLKYLLTDYPISIARRQVYGAYARLAPPDGPREYIVILGHMRAGSSLLTKLLCSNPEVLGYGETHMPYGSLADARAASGKIRYVLRSSLERERVARAKYYLDKLLHSYLIPHHRREILLNEKIKVIFLLREPGETIASTMKLLGWSEESASNYYVERIRTLRDYAALMHGKKPFFCATYANVVNDTERVFRDLEGFLGLSHPLSETYDVVTKKGGDPSGALSAGTILRNRQRPKLEISPEMLYQGNAAYTDAMAALTHEQ